MYKNRFIKQHIIDNKRVIFEAAIVNNKPCLIAIVDYGRSTAVRALKKTYAVSNLEIAKSKVTNSTIEDAKKLLNSIFAELEFASCIEVAFSKPIEFSKNKRNQACFS